jgi:hypothetical protein
MTDKPDIDYITTKPASSQYEQELNFIAPFSLAER